MADGGHRHPDRCHGHGVERDAALFFSTPAVMRGFQAAGFAMSVLFGVLFVGLGLVVAWDVLRGWI